MRYLALCTDYDGTIAHDGRVDGATLQALEELKASGRRLVLVTGREIDDLQKVCDRLDLFDRVVAENGALIYHPATREERLIGDPPPGRFVEELARRGVRDVSVGRCIVATWEPNEGPVLEVIRDLGLELQVIFNKGAVMVLPGGINKAAGLKAALDELNVSIHNTVAVGDAENDHALLAACEFSAAVANALPSVKEKVDLVLDKDHGAGVAQLIGQILADDLASHAHRLRRHEIRLGADESGEATLSPYGVSALVVGTSGGGKSTVAAGLIERLRAKGYAFCVIDPEGDYDAVEGAAVLGSPERAPSLDECMQLLAKPGENAVFNLLGLKLNDRPAFFMSLLARIRDLRVKTGRPHWLIVDEAHHVMPAEWLPGDTAMPGRLDGVLLVTLTPGAIATAALELIDSILVLGEKPREMLDEFAAAHGRPAPTVKTGKVPEGHVLLWDVTAGAEVRDIRLEPTRTERKRHLRKYAEGALAEDRSFYFRGPQQKLNLRAQNLIVFMDLADGVDEDTWLYHWKRGDVSGWLRECVKDDELAGRVQAVERELPDDPAVSRQRMREVIEGMYTLPAEGATAR